MKLKSDGATLNGFLDRGSNFSGDLSFEQTFRIDGRFQGKIRSGSELIIGDSAEVDADIEVERISVNGRLAGVVRAKERIELMPGARVSAELISPIIRIDEGAVFDGTCKMAEKPRVAAIVAK
ncbi:MAG TPA: polymer-forming cytoskeletal protein [Thermoanaerobaculia bacterium]|jgi:cytoskeletal protein CcmA (bactofilin family)